MTETNRYNNGKIYKIISPHTDKIYVGSTCKERLCQRLAGHKSNYKHWLKDNNNGYMTSYVLFELGDVEIILLENINCMTKDELLKKEREWTEKLKDSIVNKYKPMTTKEEKKEDNKVYKKVYRAENEEILKEKEKKYKKEYYDDNKEILKERQNMYYQKNKELINEKQKEYFKQYNKVYRTEHKEEKKQYNKIYRAENKEKLKEKIKEQIQCECGSVITKGSKAKHAKSHTHQQYINSLVSKSVLKT